jgi:hypothetical protein
MSGEGRELQRLATNDNEDVVDDDFAGQRLAANENEDMADDQDMTVDRLAANDNEDVAEDEGA